MKQSAAQLVPGRITGSHKRRKENAVCQRVGQPVKKKKKPAAASVASNSGEKAAPEKTQAAEDPATEKQPAEERPTAADSNGAGPAKKATKRGQKTSTTSLKIEPAKIKATKQKAPTTAAVVGSAGSKYPTGISTKKVADATTKAKKTATGYKKPVPEKILGAAAAKNKGFARAKKVATKKPTNKSVDSTKGEKGHRSQSAQRR